MPKKGTIKYYFYYIILMKSKSPTYEPQNKFKMCHFSQFKFPHNQYQIAPFLMTGKALVQYMAISLTKRVKPLI